MLPKSCCRTEYLRPRTLLYTCSNYVMRLPVVSLRSIDGALGESVTCGSNCGLRGATGPGNLRSCVRIFVSSIRPWWRLRHRRQDCYAEDEDVIVVVVADGVGAAAALLASGKTDGGTERKENGSWFFQRSPIHILRPCSLPPFLVQSHPLSQRHTHQFSNHWPAIVNLAIRYRLIEG